MGFGDQNESMKEKKKPSRMPVPIRRPKGLIFGRASLQALSQDSWEAPVLLGWITCKRAS